MPYYNRKEYPKQIWVSQIPEREVSLLRENLAGIKQTTFVLMKKEEDFMPFIFWKTACFHRITKKSCLKNGRKKKSGNLLKRSVQLFGMISAIFLFRNHRNIHSIRYLLWTAGWESAPTEEKGDMKAVI